MKIKQNPFKLEKIRSRHAANGNLNKLRTLYSSNYPEISNDNTGILWDNLNFNNELLLKKTPIFIDKLRIVANELSGKTGKVLDIGIGIGELEKDLLLKTTKLKLYGTDISTKSLREVKKRVKKVTVKRTNLQKLPFKENFFDYVVILDVLEHISPSKVFKVYKEIVRVMKKNAKIIISIPLNEGLEKMVKKGLNPNAHVRIYTPELIKAELSLFNFLAEKEYKLFAFNSFYFLKNYFCQHIMKGYRKPNLLILIAKKI